MMKRKENDFNIGVDIVYIPRIRDIINSKEKNRFLKRCFSTKEVKEFLRKRQNGIQYLAGRFALKEALVKIIGKRSGIRFSEISCQSTNGVPTLNFTGKTLAIFKKYKISFSISHDNEYAIAIAIGRRVK